MSEKDEKPYVVIEREETAGQIVAFLIGAAVGASVALLLAPSSGAETRHRLLEGSQRLRDAAGTGVREAHRQLEERLDMARDGARGPMGTVREAVEVGRKAADEARRDLEEKVAASKAAYRAGVEAAKGVLASGAEGDSEDVDNDAPGNEAPSTSTGQDGEGPARDGSTT